VAGQGVLAVQLQSDGSGLAGGAAVSSEWDAAGDGLPARRAGRTKLVTPLAGGSATTHTDAGNQTTVTVDSWGPNNTTVTWWERYTTDAFRQQVKVTEPKPGSADTDGTNYTYSFFGSWRKYR